MAVFDDTFDNLESIDFSSVLLKVSNNFSPIVLPKDSPAKKPATPPTAPPTNVPKPGTTEPAAPPIRPPNSAPPTPPKADPTAPATTFFMSFSDILPASWSSMACLTSIIRPAPAAIKLKPGILFKNFNTPFAPRSALLPTLVADLTNFPAPLPTRLAPPLTPFNNEPAPRAAIAPPARSAILSSNPSSFSGAAVVAPPFLLANIAFTNSLWRLSDSIFFDFSKSLFNSN